MNYQLGRFFGITVILVGFIVLSAGLIMFAVSWVGGQSLKALEFTEAITPIASFDQQSGVTLQQVKGLNIGEVGSEAKEVFVSAPDPRYIQLYPGENLPFSLWKEPRTNEPFDNKSSNILEGFLPIGAFEIGSTGQMPVAKGLRIPILELEATVTELGIVDLGDSLEYETPKRVVGHIPETANPGESGRVWLFGHLQSPLRGEGSVFRDLPLIPKKLRNGEQVYALLDGSRGTYLYEIRSSEVLSEEDLYLYSTLDSTITLVTCVPRFTYDHRLLIHGELIGFKPNFRSGSMI
ncbi:MAG: Sortase (surface protein transpeptidase) [Chloroflexi bacterium]|jgi:LPXTG-site transpeptidase (sortase) family protein|nr:MAG: Sortase (surface protein transpeptidase) [Chloroflexota bacterium]